MAWVVAQPFLGRLFGVFTDKLSHLVILNHLAERLGHFFAQAPSVQPELVRILHSQKGFSRGMTPDMRVTSWS